MAETLEMANYILKDKVQELREELLDLKIEIFAHKFSHVDSCTIIQEHINQASTLEITLNNN